MNKTEQRAYDYIALLGDTDIKFHSHSTPDFTTNIRTFEVKFLEGYSAISFSKRQFDILKTMPETIILVFTNVGDNPYKEFLFKEIADGKTEYENLNIKVRDDKCIIALTPEAKFHLDILRRNHEYYSEVVMRLIRAYYSKSSKEMPAYKENNDNEKS